MVTVCEVCVWFEMTSVTGPAPNFAGETVTLLSVMTPVSWIGTGGRGLFLKSLPPQPATSAPMSTPPERSAARRIHPLSMTLLIPPRYTLAEPDRLTLSRQPIDLALNPRADLLGDRLHELDVVRVARAVSVERHRLEEAKFEFSRQVHERRREPEVRERVVDREVDEPGQLLEQRHVREDRHRLLGAHARDRDYRRPSAQRRLHEPAAAEATQAVALPVQLARGLHALGEDHHEPALVAQEPRGVRGMSPHEPDLVREHADARVALEPVLAEHVQRPRRGMLVADRLHDHRPVRRQRARVVGDEQGAALGRDVLDALLLDPEPVAVVEVEQRLHELEEALGPAPVVDLAARLRRRDQLAQRPRVEALVELARLREGDRIGYAEGIVTRVERTRRRPRVLGSGVTCEWAAEKRAIGAQAPSTSARSSSSCLSRFCRRPQDSSSACS